MNRDTTRLELNIRAKQIIEHWNNLKEYTADIFFQFRNHDNHTTSNNNSYNTGRATAQNGGQTEYDAGDDTANGVVTAM